MGRHEDTEHREEVVTASFALETQSKGRKYCPYRQPVALTTQQHNLAVNPHAMYTSKSRFCRSAVHLKHIQQCSSTLADHNSTSSMIKKRDHFMELSRWRKSNLLLPVSQVSQGEAGVHYYCKAVSLCVATLKNSCLFSPLHHSVTAIAYTYSK